MIEKFKNAPAMRKGTLLSARSIGGREGKYSSRHMKIVETLCDNVYHLDTNRGGSIKNKIAKYSGLDVKASLNLYGEYYEKEVTQMKTWDEAYDKLDASLLADNDHLFIFSGIDLYRSNMTRFGKRVNVFPKDSGQLKFRSHGKLFTIILAMVKANREYGIPLHEYQYDTGEISTNLFHPDYRPLKDLYHTYHNYNIPTYDIHRMDSLQYYLNSKENGIFDFEPEKTVDFSFAYTVLKNSKRKDFPEFVNAVVSNFEENRIFTINDFTGVDTSIDPETYYRLIRSTRFTMILPAYERISFAIDRFITSLHCNCLPMLVSGCPVDDVESSYGISLKELIIEKPEDVKRYTESVRIELLEKYREKFLKYERGFII